MQPCCLATLYAWPTMRSVSSLVRFCASHRRWNIARRSGVMKNAIMSKISMGSIAPRVYMQNRGIPRTCATCNEGFRPIHTENEAPQSWFLILSMIPRNDLNVIFSLSGTRLVCNTRCFEGPVHPDLQLYENVIELTLYFHLACAPLPQLHEGMFETLGSQCPHCCMT